NYVLQASSMSDFSGTIISSVSASSTTTTLTTPATLTPNTTYYLRFGVLDNNQTTQYAPASYSTSTLTSAVTGAQIYLVGATSITVNWVGLGTGNSEGYMLQTSTASDFTGTILSSSTPDVNQSTLTVTGLSGLTTYYFRVSGLNWNNNTNFVAVPSSGITSTSGYYWIKAGGSSSNWNNAANWSSTSGGAASTVVPNSGMTAIFDGNGKGGCNIDIDLTLATLQIATSTKAGYNGVIDASTHTIV